MPDIHIEGTETDGGWTFAISVSDSGQPTYHQVTLDRATYDRLTDGRVSAEELVRRSFEFLLEHESQESILRSFDLTVIGRYFPEYEEEIRGRIAGD